MNHTTQIDNTKLSVWYYAVKWAKHRLQQTIADIESRGTIDPAFDIQRLEELEDLEQFLNMSWYQWMDSLTIDQTAVEEIK
jgi:hypothetical protein